MIGGYEVVRDWALRSFGRLSEDSDIRTPKPRSTSMEALCPNFGADCDRDSSPTKHERKAT